jgi:ABC-2 type transport system permease protein
MTAITDAFVIMKRQLLQLVRVPEVLIFSTIQPVMFVMLFRYVFGGSISTGQPGGYVQLLMPGIFVQTVAFTLAGTAVGLAADMQKGLIDRFRSLPISRGAVVFGRTLGDAESWASLALLSAGARARAWCTSSLAFSSCCSSDLRCHGSA